MFSNHETMNRSSGNINMSPTPFKGVMALGEAESLPSVPAMATDANGSSSSSSLHGGASPNKVYAGASSAMYSASISPPSFGETSSSQPDTTRASAAAAAASSSIVSPSSSHAPMSPSMQHVRSRKASSSTKHKSKKAESRRHRRKRKNSKDYSSSSGHCVKFASSTTPSKNSSSRGGYSIFGYSTTRCCDRTLVRSTLSCMNLLARLLFWCSAMASVAAVVWYSYELKKHGTDPHLIAWFSAGAFVLLGFPISMYGIVMHMANYNQPNVQMYVVRILWMVPIYSIESWLCLRYKDYAIYIETLRDCYESYVLYSFLQFLIQVLGGEEALILMLKDKSPTRGVHMWGLQWCVKPWLMGQPVRKTYENFPTTAAAATTTTTTVTTTASTAIAPQIAGDKASPRPLKRVHWTSPFFVKCKFGVLQYVLLKFICSLVVVILERNHIYKEGDFTPKGGYLYICILTNLSQCWALYCMIFFYYATKNELSNIRPVGKFLSVKALVFFTWWQSVSISMLYQMDLIPHYHGGTGMGFGVWGGSTGVGDPDQDLSGSNDDAIMIDSAGSNAILPLSAEEALALDEFGGSVLTASSHPFLLGGSSSSSFASYHSATKQQEWSAEDVAKGMQDYLICIEMFVAAIVHFFVFPHTEFDPQAVEARTRALNQTPHKDWNKRLGRKWKEWDNKSGWSGTTNTSSDVVELGTTHMATLHSASSTQSLDDDDDLCIHPLDRLREESQDYGDDDDDDEEGREFKPLLSLDPIQSDPTDDDDEDGEDGAGSSTYSLESSVLHDDDNSYQDDGDSDDEDLENPSASHKRGSSSSMPSLAGSAPSGATSAVRKPGFVRALLDSAIPQDLRDNTVGIIKGDYVVEKKTLLHHAATSDSYDLFSRVNRPRAAAKRPTSIFASKTSSKSVD